MKLILTQLTDVQATYQTAKKPQTRLSEKFLFQIKANIKQGTRASFSKLCVTFQGHPFLIAEVLFSTLKQLNQIYGSI